jgi:hypothetical protein
VPGDWGFESLAPPYLSDDAKAARDPIHGPSTGYRSMLYRFPPHLDAVTKLGIYRTS